MKNIGENGPDCTKEELLLHRKRLRKAMEAGAELPVTAAVDVVAIFPQKKQLPMIYYESKVLVKTRDLGHFFDWTDVLVERTAYKHVGRACCVVSLPPTKEKRTIDSLEDAIKHVSLEDAIKHVYSRELSRDFAATLRLSQRVELILGLVETWRPGNGQLDFVICMIRALAALQRVTRPLWPDSFAVECPFRAAME